MISEIMEPQRGWVLQERLLSPRIIHFSSRQVIWECDETRASESFPDELPSVWPVTKRIEIERLTSEDDFLGLWGNILERYSTTRLTYRSDLMPALSGIARRLQQNTGATYLAGIWQPPRWFEVHLAWHSLSPPLPRPAGYRAPSWSWASTDNRVILDPISAISEGWGNACLWQDDYVECKVKIHDAQIILASSDPMGSASSGFIVVEGPLNRIIMHPDMQPLSDGGPFRVKISLDEPLDMEIFLDEPLTKEKVLYTLPLFKYWSDNPDFDGHDVVVYKYLILEFSDKQPGCYTRAGLGRTTKIGSDPKLWDNVINALDTPCEEFLGQAVGHRIRII